MKTQPIMGKLVLPVILLLGTGYSLLPDNDGSPDSQLTVSSGEENMDLIQNVSAVELGRLLFWDPILSGNKDIACGTCHHPDFGYSDGRDISIGTMGIGLGPDRSDASGGAIPPVKRNSQTVLNTVFNGLDDGRGRGRSEFEDSPADPQLLASISQVRAPMFWDSRTSSLEAQSLEPLKTREEMRGDIFTQDTAVDSVVARLKAIPEYVNLFQEVYGTSTTIDANFLGDAIAAFERSLTAVNSPFDRYTEGDRSAMTPQQIRGFDTFLDVGCDECHEGPMFSDFELHTLGIPEHPDVANPDSGDGRFRFRTPSLRNVALTAPYMHNGMLASLEDVLEFYDEGESENPNISNGGRGRGRGDDDDDDGGGFAFASVDGDFRRVDNMNDQEMRDIIAFLEALTDDNFDRIIPESVPSGLPPGGL